MIARILRHTAALERQTVLGHLGWLRGAIGAALGIFVAGGTTMIVIGLIATDQADALLPWLMAPLGASAMLVFCVPASPLAQPWPLIGGSLISAATGLAAGHFLGSPWLASGAAVGTAIALMTLARCLHPPGGACALLCALGSTGPETWGSHHLLPIAANVLALAATGWLYNNMTGHPWPHTMPKIPAAVAPAVTPSYQRENLEAVLEEWDEILDVDIDDLDALFQAVERRGLARALSGGS